MVLGGDGTLLERRLVWQDSLRATRPDSEVPAKGEAVLFNAMPFNTAAPGRRLRFEIDVDPAAAAGPLTVEVVPVDCAAGQPRLILPLSGRVLVYDGYDALSHHRRSDFRGSLGEVMGITGNFQRFGIDLVAVDRAGTLVARRRQKDVRLARLGPAGARCGGGDNRRDAQCPARQCRTGQRRQMGRAEERGADVELWQLCADRPWRGRVHALRPFARRQRQGRRGRQGAGRPDARRDRQFGRLGRRPSALRAAPRPRLRAEPISRPSRCSSTASSWSAAKRTGATRRWRSTPGMC